MKALIYNGPRDVSVTDVDDPRIERPTDVLVRITRTNICGSDLHMYEGRTDMEAGRVLGHENLGEVVEIGTGFKSQRMGSGQCPVKRYNRQLRDLIHVGKAKPSWIVSHQLPLTTAADAYEHFDRRDTGWTKVVLSPAETNGGSAR
jgi:threonine dehydrogenase-like Zn-dependent dehydrogenase